MLRTLFLTLIRFYRRGISPFTPASCRFTPTCSAYAQEAIETHGTARGLWLFLKRFGRCHPFGGSGFDPVPPARQGGREGTAADPAPDSPSPHPRSAA